MPSLSKSVAFIKSFDASSEEQRKRLIEEVYGGSRNKLKEAACALISSPRFAQKMAVRLGALSVLVYLGADAVPEIAGILKKRSKPLDYEIHFSLFCRLERERYKNSAKTEKRVLQLVQSYLFSVPSPNGQAAWMAGDLLHHWGTPSAIQVLRLAARNAKHPAGRIGAVHGLQHVLNTARDCRFLI